MEVHFPTNDRPLGETTMDHSKIIAKLNEALRHEWTGVAQYAQAGYLVTGPWREVYSGLFFDSAKESFGHARQVGDKIVAYGGVPTVERNPIKQSHDLHEMLEHALEFESTAVKLYMELLAMADDAKDRPLVVFLENILLEEQDGVEHITKLLRDQPAAEGKKGASGSRAG